MKHIKIFFSDMWAGLGYLEGYGSHPGWIVLVLLGMPVVASIAIVDRPLNFGLVAFLPLVLLFLLGARNRGALARTQAEREAAPLVSKSRATPDDGRS